MEFCVCGDFRCEAHATTIAALENIDRDRATEFARIESGRQAMVDEITSLRVYTPEFFISHFHS